MQGFQIKAPYVVWATNTLEHLKGLVDAAQK